MKIDAASLEKIIWILYDRYFDYQEITLKEVKVTIDKYVRVHMVVHYYNVETVIRILCRLRVDQDLIIDTKGSVKYGLIHFDFNKLIKEYFKDNRYVCVNDESLIIKNEYIKNIAICQKNIELELI